MCLFESTLHLVASSDAMDQKDVGELLRLLNAARHSGVLDTILESMKVPEVAQGSMTDAGKRRKGSGKGDQDFSSSEWSEIEFTGDDPSKDGVARFETDPDGKMSAKVLSPPTEHIRHVDKSVKVPRDAGSFENWGKTIVKMDKYAKMGWSFAELVSFAETDKKAMTYVRWLIGTYATPPVLEPENQAVDFGTYARACGVQPKKKGYVRETK